MEVKGFMLDKPFYFLDYYKFKTKIFHEQILPKSKIFRGYKNSSAIECSLQNISVCKAGKYCF